MSTDQAIQDKPKQPDPDVPPPNLDYAKIMADTPTPPPTPAPVTDTGTTTGTKLTTSGTTDSFAQGGKGTWPPSVNFVSATTPGGDKPAGKDAPDKPPPAGDSTTGDTKPGGDQPTKPGSGADGKEKEPHVFSEKYTKEAADDAVKALGGDDFKAREAAQKKLSNMGPDAIPHLEALKDKTDSYDAYVRARDAIDSIKKHMPGEADKSKFTTPYNKEDAAKLIKDLDSDNAVDRARARDKLFSMGPDALGDIQKANDAANKAEPRNAEVSRSTKDLIRRINGQADHESMKGYDKTADSVERAFNKAGIGVDKQRLMIADGDGNISTIGPSRVIGDPKKGAPTAADRKAFEQLIKDGDKLGGDKRFDKMHKDAKDGDTDKYPNLAVAGWSKDARSAYARALSSSNDPKDHTKGVDLLKEQLAKQPGQKPDYIMTDAAARLGADKDAKFMEAYKKAGGDVDELKQSAADYAAARKKK